MKRLDRYVAESFVVGYAISFCVLIGLRIVLDLFVNIDEFTEHAGLSALDIIRNIFIYYGLNSTLYFRDFAGFIMVIAAVFSLGKMVRNNEFVAMMASGVSLKRVIAPIVVLAFFLTAVLVVDQELLIPSLADKLVRSEDDLPGRESYDVWFIADGNGSLICSQRFDVESSTLYDPTILLRKRDTDTSVWKVTAQITAKRAVFNERSRRWDLVEGRIISRGAAGPARPIGTFGSDITDKDIPVRRRAEYKTLLSSGQLAALERQKTKIKDMAVLSSQRQFRITEPVINLVMLMVSLPILLCRDPRAMKSAVMISFSMAGLCFITTFLCKMFATEAVFERVMPQFWPWVPVFIFLPIALIELDSMKT